MGWWKQFKTWLREPEFPESPLKDWEPKARGIEAVSRHPVDDWTAFEEEWAPKVPSTALRWSDVGAASSQDNAPAVTPSISDPIRSDAESDGKSVNGEETTSSLPDDDGWFWAETEEEKAPEVIEVLEHADNLPLYTYRVFPAAGNHRNSYDSGTSVARAIRARKRYLDEDEVKIYRACTIWEDVTDEFIKP